MSRSPIVNALAILLIVVSTAMASAGNVVEGGFGKKTPQGPETILTFAVILDQNEFPDAFAKLKQALEAVIILAPPGVRLQFSNEELTSLAIEVTNTQIPEAYPEPHNFQRGYFESLPGDVDSATYIPAMTSRHGPHAVQLYWDRIVNEIAVKGPKKGQLISRYDEFTRLTVAIAREVYGSVLLVQTRPDVLPIDDPRHQKTDEFKQIDQAVLRRASFEAGVAFLERFAVLARKMNLGQGSYNDIALALSREQRNLVAAQRDVDAAMAAHASAKATPVAEIRSLGAARCERVFQPTK